MTVLSNDLTIRPLAGSEELSLFDRFPYLLNEEFPRDIADGRRRPSWMWVALHGDRLIGRLSWWCRPQDDAPFLLDVFDVVDSPDIDRTDVARHLLRTASAATLAPDAGLPEFLRFLPAGWREDPAEASMVRDLMKVLEGEGYSPLAERLRFELPAGTPAPRPGGRLRFREIEDTDEILGLMTRALEGTLDAHDRADLRDKSAEEVAAANFADEFAEYTTPRSWWRVATLPDGEPVGFVIPARNAYHPIIAYIAVLPEHRGHGHIDDLLAEGGRVLREEGEAEYVRAATDLGNGPMAAAFRRAGYEVLSELLTMTGERP
ncbi:GNAT family N-acetyltransferase [Nocardiopsis alba]|uniref:GNAT family N-acetyltransferase n=1 Tax=Nocardiopsis alba TaxID=53437 RepID=A0A7K2IP42_9ACTN|nr:MULTISPECIES: GNAT family N-acetyltransferase [Nocardiopsis]MEC3894139.1 GNAT family N-acetyltransferase [Nocardiopsis sp. LDBS1602]MYR31751.1 GNAT family N-acetyltransferase [Nocardiopsis alba]